MDSREMITQRIERYFHFKHGTLLRMDDSHLILFGDPYIAKIPTQYVKRGEVRYVPTLKKSYEMWEKTIYQLTDEEFNSLVEKLENEGAMKKIDQYRSALDFPINL